MDEHILLVDDAKFARKVAIRALHNGGFDNITEAVTAKEALELFEKEKPDLVLLDITLPDNSETAGCKDHHDIGNRTGTHYYGCIKSWCEIFYYKAI